MTVQTTETEVRPEAVLAEAYAYSAQQQAAQAELVATALTVWATLDLKDAVQSWVAGIGQRIYVLLSLLQQLMANDANLYVRRVLALQGVPYTGPMINPRNFAGIASDGRDLESLLAGAVVQVRKAQHMGLSDEEAARRGANWLRMTLMTQTSDQARAAESVSLTVANPEITVGWTRLLTPPSCGRCAVLAGRFYKWSDGFERHPMCFPAGTLVSGPRLDAATRRWFEGELVTVRTASGQELSLTGNHPVLTDGGWVPARLLQEGDHVIRSLGAQTALGQIPDDHQVPAPVEDVFGALGVAGPATKVPSAAEDFHGDGAGGEVDVVATDGHLGLEEMAGVVQVPPESLLGGGFEASFLHSGASGLIEGRFAGAGAPDGVMGGSGLGIALLGGHLAHAQQPGFRAAPDLHTMLQQARAEGWPGDVVLAAEAVLALAARVLRRDLGNGEVDRPGLRGNVVAAPRWDALGSPETMEGAQGYTERGRDLVDRLTGQVALDRVVEKVSRQWSGHVFNLTSSEGWLVAEGIVTSNCDCRHIPCTVAGSDDLTTDPMVYFNSLSTEQQDRLFGRAQAQAIRDGADINQVVNASARPGAMFTADNGRRYTGEGAGKRGLFGQSDIKGRKPKVLRPTPLQIYRDANGDKDAAIEMLRRFRYIL